MKVVGLSLAISAALVFSPTLFASQSHQKPIEVHPRGTTSFAQADVRAQTAPFAVQPKVTRRPGTKPFLQSQPRSFEALRSLASGLVFGGFPVVGPNKSFWGFDGLDTRDSGIATGFVAEPPDQALATDGVQVFEAVNTALQLFRTNGAPLIGPRSLNTFFGVPTVPDKAGNSEELSDPRVIFDWQTYRWFVSIVEFTVTAKGALTGGSAVLIAASTSSDALGTYNVYSINASDADFGDCPCLGDQPLLGFNADGIYLNTNEFSTTTGRFQTSLILALNKIDLIDGSPTITAVGFDGLTLAEGLAFSIQPALTAPGTNTSQNNGTEFFTSSLDFSNIGDNRLAVWALTNTETLEDRVPNLNLLQQVIVSEEYGAPAPAIQKAGSIPLGRALKEPEELLDTNDDRMQQTYQANGTLYCALTTLLLDPLGASGPRAGAAWFAIDADASFTTLFAHVEHQGYIGIKDGSVMFPSFAVNGRGDGVIGFSFSGTNYYPSTGYVNFDDGVVESKVHLAGIGQTPEDGFSGYAAFGGGGVARWGDYSAAVVAPDGHLWFATEYIPNPFARRRTLFTNWGTFISRVH